MSDWYSGEPDPYDKEMADLKAENERLTDALADADAHIESLQNTVAQVTAENVALGEYVDADREAQNEIKKLEAENERLGNRLKGYDKYAESIIDITKDAERYRWMRDKGVHFAQSLSDRWMMDAQRVDEVIDESMKNAERHKRNIE